MPQRTRNEMRYSDVKDTIFALSTPVGGAISILRASGSECYSVLKAIFSGRIAPRMLNYGKIHTVSAPVRDLDNAMAVYFPAPNSYTGEDMFELNLHGSYAVAREITELLENLGLRLADPGEFTKRAFLNGKMDLVQANAVMDLINSDTDRSADAALDQLNGGLSGRIAVIEEKLIASACELAAAMDYPDEMEDEVLSDSEAVLRVCVRELEKLISSGKKGRILREGAKVVIIGRPNAGKSSLMNALTGTNRAIVTDIAGTTRDTIEEKLDIAGCPVRLIDTAGLRESCDTVERMGIERARHEAETAELVIKMFDGTEIPSSYEIAELGSDGTNTLYAVNKSDICGENIEKVKNTLLEFVPEERLLVISCETGEGLGKLTEKIAESISSGESSGALVTNERHICCLTKAKKELEDALAAPTTDLKALALGSALEFLGEITGRTAGEEVIDGIFSRFCVGK